jgi:hypothetical protein
MKKAVTVNLEFSQFTAALFSAVKSDLIVGDA